MKAKLIILLLLMAPLEVQANIFDNPKALSYIVERLPKLENTTCKFTQDKYIPTSKIHLVSGGDFKFDKNKGVTFFVNYPVKTTISYTNSEYKQINNIIKAIVNKNFSLLEKDFKFYYEEHNSVWTLGLKPKVKSKASAYIASIEITGKKDISEIIITMVDKTKTDIKFSK